MTALTVLEVYLLADDMRAQLFVADGRWRISLRGTVLREGVLRREPIFSGV